MRIAYLHCFAGISGDMFLGALVDAGVPLSVLEDAVASLDLDASLRMETVDRSGISSTKVHVFEGNRLAEDAPHAHHDHPHKHASKHEQPHEHPHEPKHDHGHEHAHEHEHPHDHDHPHKHDHDHEHTHDHEHPHKHDHEPSHEHHAHDHPHVHGRSLTQIRALIEASPLSQRIKQRALHTFQVLGHAEAKVHNVPVEQIHFHEVGAVDAIVDIVAGCTGIEYLEERHRGIRWHCSPVNVGGGMVQCAHGNFPVPAPAVLNLLRDVPTYSADVLKELTTPTGAALLRALAPAYGQQPAMRIETVGYGAGTRNTKGFPNVLRLTLGESAETDSAQEDEVTVLETALDDATPQLMAHVAEQALALGALDVMLTPVVMKKGRPATLLTVLCEPAQRAQFTQLLLRETTTLGVRVRTDKRVCLDRKHVPVHTPYGEVRMKLGLLGDEILNAHPEYEDCRAAAASSGASLKDVTQAAVAAYRERAR